VTAAAIVSAPSPLQQQPQVDGLLLGYAVGTVTLFDTTGRFMRQESAGALPSIPAAGVPFTKTVKGLILVRIGTQELVLDPTELQTKTAKQVASSCEEMRKLGPASRAVTNGAAGHGNCW
jgi:hypothetical protein